MSTGGALRRALLSVYDKRGLAEFAKGLHDLGYESDAIAFLDWLMHTTALTRPKV